MRAAFDGHGGDQRNAHAGADKSEQTGELTAFEDYLGRDARAIAGGHGVFAEAVAVAQQEEWLAAEIAKDDGGAARETVFFWKSGKERLREQRERVEFVAADGKRQDGNIDGAGAEAFEENGGNFFDDDHRGFREAFGKSGENRGKEIRGYGGNDAHGDLTGDRILAFDDIAARGLEFAEDCAGAREKCLANIGEADGTTKAIEEASAEFGFELKDLL